MKISKIFKVNRIKNNKILNCKINGNQSKEMFKINFFNCDNFYLCCTAYSLPCWIIGTIKRKTDLQLLCD